MKCKQFMNMNSFKCFLVRVLLTLDLRGLCLILHSLYVCFCRLAVSVFLLASCDCCTMFQLCIFTTCRCDERRFLRLLFNRQFSSFSFMNSRLCYSFFSVQLCVSLLLAFRFHVEISKTKLKCCLHLPITYFLILTRRFCQSQPPWRNFFRYPWISFWFNNISCCILLGDKAFLFSSSAPVERTNNAWLSYFGPPPRFSLQLFHFQV